MNEVINGVDLGAWCSAVWYVWRRMAIVFFFWYIVSAAATQLRAWSLHMELEKITDEQSSVTHAYQDAHPSYRNKQTHWEV